MAAPAEPPLDQEGFEFLLQHLGGKVSRQDAIALLTQAREEALRVREFRCIKEWRFLESRLFKHPEIKSILHDIEHKRFLDLGCCMGTDVRKLLSVGASAANVFGVDYQHEFLDLGFRIFGDREKLRSCFVEGNLLQEQQTRELIKHARGDKPWDIVYYGSVFHLFTEELIEYLVQFARSFLRDGGLLIGGCVANPTPGMANDGGGLRFLHSPESLTSLLHACGFDDVRIAWRRMPSAGPQGERWGWLSFYAVKKPVV